MTNLNIPLTTWIVVLAAVVLFVVITLFRKHSRKPHHAHSHAAGPHRHIIGLTSESDEFYIPGDPLPDKDNDYTNPDS